MEVYPSQLDVTQRDDKTQAELLYHKAKRQKQEITDIGSFESFSSMTEFEKAIDNMNYVSLQKACKEKRVPANKKKADLQLALKTLFQEYMERDNEEIPSDSFDELYCQLSMISSVDDANNDGDHEDEQVCDETDDQH